MRNPDQWQPPEPGPKSTHNPRRAALMGLAVIALLIAGGLILTHVLGSARRLQDCVLSGRSNCQEH